MQIKHKLFLWIVGIGAAMLLLFSCQPATASTKEDCTAVASIAFTVAEARDQGVHPVQIIQVLIYNGYSQKAAYGLVYVVYEGLANNTPEEINSVYYKACMGEPT